MSAKSLELYNDAYRNVRETTLSSIVQGYNQFKELEKRAAHEPLSLKEIQFNLALALYRIDDQEKFDEIAGSSRDVRVAQLSEIITRNPAVEQVASSRQKQVRTAVQQISFILLTASILTFVSHL